jgi:puromycin-sensitive aminopeptidase
LQDPGSADPLFAGAALAIAAIDGDDALFNSIVAKLKGTTDQILRGRYMRALQHFEKPELVEKAMELGVSGAIRNQDAPMYLDGFLRNPATRPQAWAFVRKRWNEISKDFNASLFGGSALVAGAGQFCDADAASDVNAFFKVHPVPAAERALRQSLERINSCADLKKMQSPNLQSWLIEHGGTQTASSEK